LDKFNRILKTLEEELNLKVEKIKSQEGHIDSIENEKKKVEARYKELSKQYEKIKKEININGQAK
jgi:archaellum component FlaC